MEAAIISELMGVALEDVLTTKEAGAVGKINLPLLGDIDQEMLSLPLMTLALAGVNALNPCSLYVLLFLMSFMVHAKSRGRILLAGGTFVICSGIIYFLFMSAWIKAFEVTGQITLITMVAGTIALVLGFLNTRDYFSSDETTQSVGISNSNKPPLIARMRGLIKVESNLSLFLGAASLAVLANFYAILCTAGLAIAFTSILVSSGLTRGEYYSYLALYNVIYVLPLGAVVAIFAVTLGSRKLSIWQGKILKLLAGVMLVTIGSVLVVKPELLNNALAAFFVLVLSAVITAVIAAVGRQSS